MHQLEHRRGQAFQEGEDRTALLTHRCQRDAEQHRHEQHLQDVVAHERAQQRLGDDVHGKADQGQLVRLLHVAVDRRLVQAGRIDVHAGARLHHVRHHQADHQCQRGEEDEIDHRLGEDAAHGTQVGHAGDAGDDGQEDHRGDDHLHQLDEGITQRLERFGEGRLEVAEQHAQGDGQQHLEIQLPVERQADGGCRNGIGGNVHGIPRRGSLRPCCTRPPPCRR
ncbi:hypothetical protein D3C71_906460 [compost metagenome]